MSKQKKLLDAIFVEIDEALSVPSYHKTCEIDFDTAQKLLKKYKALGAEPENKLIVETQGYMQNEKEKQMSFEREDAMRIERDQANTNLSEERQHHMHTVIQRDAYKSEREEFARKYNNECAAHDKTIQLRTLDILEKEKLKNRLAGILPTCTTCDGHGIIGGWSGTLNSGGYESEECPDCKGTGTK